jgi:hypothetical protein
VIVVVAVGTLWAFLTCSATMSTSSSFVAAVACHLQA